MKGIFSLLVFLAMVLMAGGSASARGLRLTDVTILLADTTSVLEIRVENIGLEAMKVFLWADIYSASGKYHGRVRSQNQEVPAHSLSAYQLSLSNLEDGVYKALVVGQYSAEDSSSEQVLASALLMEYIAPFDLSNKHIGTLTIKDSIDAQVSEKENAIGG
ncbi:MAG TPA: hypothetical protein VGA99_01080, partial [bacterium]